ncbi:ATP-binding protein [Roseateles amylovorans]|uniref:Helix-turn-helix transcriptional regulator n=1 Tax=Roseateles amylovorans TaxID=2978473 RepID=A0ABY6AYK8_9BURK|nr:helix-turn-helix transcriptional regulator [Roseateles amylovorans]UXH78269.1 helix-turn-helix transcriptional regulator [Roseateles amylovorans]
MTSRYRFEGFELDLAERVLLVQGEPVRLGSRQFDLLAVLVAHRGALVSKDALMNAVWPGQVVEENNAAVHVSALRRVLGRGAIETHAGKGYRFALRMDEPDTPPGAEPATGPSITPVALPAAPPVFIGRQHDLQALALRSAQHRLVTVVGAPGLGKSTLALACAHLRRPAFRDGVLWVDLLRDEGPLPVVSAVAMALGLEPGTELTALLAVLRSTDLLLVLDNAEVDAAQAATFCHAVLEGTEQVSLMVTSRKVLRVTGERLFRPPPLSVPAGPCDAQEALEHGAVALFVDHARAQDQGFSLGPHNVAPVIALCRRLDGLPLALQLAAGRLAMFGIDPLSERLNDRFRLLTRGTQAGPQRHRSLRASMDASHELLTDTERLVLRRLEPFEGGFTLDMVVTAVDDCGLDAWAVADALENLVDHSLVTVEAGERPRHRLSENLRAYGQLLQEEAGETDIVRRQHAHTMVQLFERAERAWHLMPDDRWLAEFAPELCNLRAAMDWCLIHDPAAGVTLLARSRELFELLGLADEVRWRHAAFESELPATLPTALRARYCIDHAHLLSTVAPVQAASWFRRAVALSRTANDPALLYLALCRQVVEDGELSLSALGELVAEINTLPEGDWSVRTRLWGLAAQAHLWALEGRGEEAVDALGNSMALATEIGAAAWLKDDLHRLTTVQLMHGQALRMRGIVRHLMACGPESIRGRALICLAVSMLAEGRAAKARVLLTEFIERWQSGSRERFERVAPVFAWLAIEEGRHDNGARLMGYVCRARFDQVESASAWRVLVGKMRHQLDGFRLARLQHEGAAWSEDEAITAALALAPAPIRNAAAADGLVEAT